MDNDVTVAFTELLNTEDDLSRNMKTFSMKQNKKRTPWVLVRERTIPTEQASLVGEVSANFVGYSGVAWSAILASTAVNLNYLDLSRYSFNESAPYLSSRC
jgi:hypothetical protein